MQSWFKRNKLPLVKITWTEEGGEPFTQKWGLYQATKHKNKQVVEMNGEYYQLLSPDLDDIQDQTARAATLAPLDYLLEKKS